jgi:hypothetical protein
MTNNNDLLAHLKETEAVIKDWPAWKKNIWPESHVVPNSVSVVTTVPATQGNFFAELASLQRHRATI